MLRLRALGSAVLSSLLVVSLAHGADVRHVAKCQMKFARAGATFAKRVIKANLKCTTAMSLCIIECENGVFGPCDSSDRNSNVTFDACMSDADSLCLQQVAKIANWEIVKQIAIINACNKLTPDELCGADAAGLNFKILVAGCTDLVPGFTCNILNLISCVGGPLERRLADQISALLNPRAADGLSVLGLEADFPGIPRARKDKEDLAPGTVDVWSIDALAGEEFTVAVVNRDDGNGSANMVPTVALLSRDGQTPVENTTIVENACPVASPCGDMCPQFTRRAPFSGNYFIEIGSSCGAGKYKLSVHSPRGSKPLLVADDALPGTYVPQ